MRMTVFVRVHMLAGYCGSRGMLVVVVVMFLLVMVMFVILMFVVLMLMVTGMSQSPDSANQQQTTHPHDCQSRNCAEYRIKLLRKNVLGEKQRHETEKENADRVG